MRKPISQRQIALDILEKIEKDNSYLSLILKKELEKIPVVDRAFITRLCYGVLQHYITLDYIIDKFCQVNKNDIELRLILRMGTYQIVFLEDIPNHSAVDESVKLARKNLQPSYVGLVNGVLRKITNNYKKIDYPNEQTQPAKYISVMNSYPEFLVWKYIKQYGVETTKEITKPLKYGALTSIRINKNVLEPDTFIEKLKQKKVYIKDGLYYDEVIRIRGAGDVSKLEEFTEGKVTVQSEGSVSVVKALDPKPGELIIDTCAAPGGKAVLAGQYMDNQGKIIAFDLHEHRLDLLRATAKRMKINNIEPKLMDATKLCEEYAEKADAVLVDAPCSGLGVIRQKPDLLYRLKSTDLNEYFGLQLGILTQASKYIKPGGRLIYSTCTLNDDENKKVINRFLKKNKNFSIKSCADKLPEKLKKFEKDSMIEILPNAKGGEGFFICQMIKTESE